MKRIIGFAVALALILCCASAFADGDALAVTMTPITWDGVGLGKVAVPEGYTLNTLINCCDENTCLGAPLRVTVAAESDEAWLFFYASETYIERVKSNYFKQKNGELDGQTMVFMQEYMNAETYTSVRAAAMVQALGATEYSFYRKEDMSHYDALLKEHRQYYENLIVPGLKQYGIGVDWVEMTAAQNAFTFDIGGMTYCVCVMAEVRGYQMNLGSVGDVEIIWDVPCYYAMVCPLSEYDRVHSTVFPVFAENTAVSDKFIELQDQLTEQIRDDTIAKWNMAVAASNAYAAAMNALTTASVESYLNSSSYSSVDRFSDYIFDQNDYTTSDGYNVKISTGYDYVWDGGNGTVYYSSSSFDMPYGATQLYPN